jgi:hypothetical protein
MAKNLIFNLPHIMFIFILPSLNQHLMQCLLYTNSRCFTNTLTRSGARWRHLQGVPAQLNFSTCQIVSNNCLTVCRGNAVFIHDMPFLKLRGDRLDDWTSTKMHRSISQTVWLVWNIVDKVMV